MPTRQSVIFALALIVLLGISYWALNPGRSGSFLFDDFVNLPALGAYGPVDNAPTLAFYLTSAMGDPVGRPLSLLSFLINANNWPAEASSFLVTNIVLHLLNGMLLVWLLLRLGLAQGWTRTQAQLSALVGAACWLLHPLFLSTTLYIIQRETILAASFVVLGFLAWVAGRQRLLEARVVSGVALLITGSVICTLMATLCKANGLLLPSLLLVAEATLFDGTGAKPSAALVRMRRLLLVLPTVILIAILVSMLPHYAELAGIQRPWTLWQRVLSEPRALLSYLDLLLLPRPISGGVFHDNFQVSADIFNPFWTLPALVLIICLAAGAWRSRRRWPVLAFAIMFFFVGHALESSVVPLELYFEHRNYLPAMPLFWPLAAWLVAPGRLHWLRVSAAAAILLALTLDTHTGAQIWGDPPRLAYAWAAYNPDSSRAQAFAAQHEMAAGEFAQARSRLLEALKTNPNDAQIAFNLADAECGLSGLQPSTVKVMEAALVASANAALLDYSWLSAAVSRARSGTCAGLDLQTVEALLSAARSNPHFVSAPGRQQDFDHIEGLLSLARGDPEQALLCFDKAVAAWPRPEVALQQAALLGNEHRPDLGLLHLDTYATYPAPPQRADFTMAGLHAWLLYRNGFWKRELEHLRSSLAQDEAQRHNASEYSDSPPA